MNEMKLFLYDFVTNRRIKRYSVAIVLFFVASVCYRIINPSFYIEMTTMSGIGFSMAFLSTLYSIYSYSTLDKIKAYLMLPFKKLYVFFSFIFAQYFSLILERMSFALIFALFFTTSPILMISYLILGSLLAVILDTVIVMSRNNKKTLLVIFSLILIAISYTLVLHSQYYVANLLILMFFVFVGIILVSRFNPKHLAIRRESKAGNNSSRSSRNLNYFVSVMIREKTPLIQTAVLFLFAATFILTAKEETILMNAVWCIFSVNTPVTTMFSGDKALLRHEKMLPSQSRLMVGVYGKFLAAYFTIANLFVIFLFAVTGNFDVSILFLGFIFIVLETGIVLFFERKYPIRDWQKKQEVWRNPRKYILPIIIFIISLIPLLFHSVSLI